MKRLIFYIIFFIFGFSMTGCDAFLIQSTNEVTNDSTLLSTEVMSTTETSITESTMIDVTTTEVQTTRDTSTTVNTVNQTTITTTEITTTLAPTTEPQTTTEMPTTTALNTTSDSERFIPTGYSLLQDELDSYGMPSTGDINILVFAIDFPDSRYDATSPSIDEIETAFNGTSNELEYESLNSYYQIVSNGLLNIQADIYGYYTVSENMSYYERQSYPESDIIDELLLHYDDQIDYTQYDQNNDGFIDGIYIIYNRPIDSESDLWWAYQWNYAYNTTYDGMTPDYFTWASNEFMYEDGESINARTYIHETGHMMGLDDYYDYSYADDYNNGGLGTYMMDYSIGDHDPFSKILLGWVQPIVIETSTSISIEPHIESGDILLIIDEWNDTIFDEYLLVTYFTPEGINQDTYDRMFDISGINIFHVSAQIDDGYDSSLNYYSIFNYNNTDTPYKLIDIIEADMNENIEAYEVVENSDLFQEGDILNQNIYLDYEWYTGLPLGFIISIDSMTSEEAIITVVFD